MTKAELIEMMSEYPEDTMVVIQGYEGGLEDITEVEKIKLKLNYNTSWYYGPHKADNNGDTDAIYLH